MQPVGANACDYLSGVLREERHGQHGRVDRRVGDAYVQGEND
jgi:hypothetical protein